MKSLPENRSVPLSFPCIQVLSPDVAEAYAILQRRLSKSQERPDGWIAVERCERSLNELLRHPSRLGSPGKLANAAWGNAGKVVRARMSRLEQCEEGSPQAPDPDNLGHLIIELHDAIESVDLSPMDQTIIDVLLAGGDSHDIAVHMGMPLPRAAVRVSRARRRVRVAWDAVA